MLLWVVLFFQMSWAGSSYPDLSPSLRQFQEVCQVTRQNPASLPEKAKLPLGEAIYLPTTVLEAGQSTFSFKRVLKSIRALSEEQDIRPKHFQFNKGKSIYPKNRRISGIRYRNKVYIIDGHHRALISTYLGAPTIPVEVIADWSYKSFKRLHEDLKSKDLTYYYGLNGKWLGPGELCEMDDEPLIFLVRSLLRRIDFIYDEETEDLSIISEKGSSTPIGLKLNRDIPFMEQEMARILRQHGIADEWKAEQELTIDFMAHCLNILLENRDGSRLSQVLLLDAPTPVAILKIKELIRDHLKRTQCKFQMLSGDRD